MITRWYHWYQLLILEVHSPKSRHELSRVKMLVHGEHNPLLSTVNWYRITFRWRCVGRGYISSFVGWLLGKLLAITWAVDLEEFLIKTVAFIGGTSENQAAKKCYICFSIDNLIANISLYALTWPKLNFGSFEII